MLNKTSKVVLVIMLMIVGMFSFVVMGNVLSEPETYKETIEVLDEKSNNVMALATSSAAMSTGLTMLPNDIGSALADEMANLTSTMMTILCAIFLEKYLLALAGAVTFKILIPLVCLLFVVYIFSKKEVLKVVAVKILVLGLALVLLVPASTTATKFIDKTYDISIDENINQIDSVAGDINKEAKKDESKVKNWVNKATKGGKDLLESVKTVLKNLIEIAAVMIVTSCIIPIVTFAALLWLLNIILGIPIPRNKIMSFAKSGHKVRRKITGKGSGNESILNE